MTLKQRVTELLPKTAFLLVGFVCANNKSFSLLEQFAQFIVEVVWSSYYKPDMDLMIILNKISDSRF